MASAHPTLPSLDYPATVRTDTHLPIEVLGEATLERVAASFKPTWLVTTAAGVTMSVAEWPPYATWAKLSTQGAKHRRIVTIVVVVGMAVTVGLSMILANPAASVARTTFFSTTLLTLCVVGIVVASRWLGSRSRGGDVMLSLAIHAVWLLLFAVVVLAMPESAVSRNFWTVYAISVAIIAWPSWKVSAWLAARRRKRIT